MSRFNRYTERYVNHFELADGKDLEVRYFVKDFGPSHPENDTSELSFYIDGCAVERSELPSEVTDQIIDELVDDAKKDSRWSFE